MKRYDKKQIYFITGASGVGKTELVKLLRNKYAGKNWTFLHFDSIGVPTIEEMKKVYGSPSSWQEVKTHEWIKKLVDDYDCEKVFLEGQANLQFIKDAFQENKFKSYKIILLDCSEDEMHYRLSNKRNQPELFTDNMKNWLMFLRKQAGELDVPVIDTSNLSPEEVLDEFEKNAGL